MRRPEALVKTTVYLGEAEYRRLKAIAREKRRPAAELVREAVGEYAARERRGRKPKSVGAGHSGRRDLSERAEELMAGLGRR